MTQEQDRKRQNPSNVTSQGPNPEQNSKAQEKTAKAGKAPPNPEQTNKAQERKKKGQA